MRVPYPRPSAGRLRRMSLGVAPTSGTCAWFIKVTFEVVMQCRRATERMLVCEEATVQRICDGDVRDYAINLASAHHVVKDSVQGRTKSSEVLQVSTSGTGSEVEHGINSRSQDTSVSIHRIYPAKTIQRLPQPRARNRSTNAEEVKRR